MKNPWLRKNPLMSIWLSGANAVLGSARSRASAEGKRQLATLSTNVFRDTMRFWTGETMRPPTKKKRKSR